ncbi:MAG: GDSL-type esterase/lipase family protein [Phycisphaeraceae bacterium]
MDFKRFNVLVLVVVGLVLVTPANADPDAQPIQVFILAGQSNMVGHGKTLNGRNPDFDPDQPQSRTNLGEVPGGIGSLLWAVQTMPKTYGFDGSDPLVDRKGDWLVRDDVSVYARMEVFKDKENPGQLTTGVTRKGPHTVGFGKADSATQKWNGPEYGFGHIVGNALDQDVLIIKVATGGTSLQGAWRSPTAVKNRGGAVGYMWPHLLRTVRHVLDNLGTEFPRYAGREVEIAGFGWHQGWNDRTEQGVAEYEANLADLITDVRAAFGEGLPVVIANTGIGGEDVGGVGLDLIDAQGAVADFEKYPGHKGNVAVVDTRPMYRDRSISPSGFGYHWNHNGITHYEIGAGMGKAYLELVGDATTRVGTHRREMPWEDPAYKTDLRATRAESRPGPDEDPNSWTAWMRHHNDRKRWVAEQETDLLMVGDSIVFGWSRVGRSVWDEFYGERNAVNIGSSGDRTYHMLYHFQNGGLDGMKGRNPEAVVVMIGTNNRGEPEQKGADTAYGILALLKEIHAKLPESKILLLAVFPRGDKPDNPGRVRNEQINRIIKRYADNETVHWLDLAHVFLNDDGTLKRELMPDGLHPNVEGYRAWAEAMEPTLKQLLGEE